MRNPKDLIPACADCHLCSFTVLKSLSEADLQTVSDGKVNMRVKKGQRIFTEGNPPNGLYALYSGKVKIHKQLANNQEQTLQLLAPSNIFGYKALLCDEEYSYSATALEDSLVCLISREVFDELLDQSHKVKKEIIFKLSEELDSIQRKLELNAKTARERVVDSLLNIMCMYGMNNETGELNAQFSRKDLANLAGLTLETTVRTLSSLKSEQLIELDQKRIVILNKKDFLEKAELY
jgi:CRP/FNR family transcriptional regulator